MPLVRKLTMKLFLAGVYEIVICLHYVNTLLLCNIRRSGWAFRIKCVRALSAGFLGGYALNAEQHLSDSQT